MGDPIRCASEIYPIKTKLLKSLLLPKCTQIEEKGHVAMIPKNNNQWRGNDYFYIFFFFFEESDDDMDACHLSDSLTCNFFIFSLGHNHRPIAMCAEHSRTAVRGAGHILLDFLGAS